MELGSILAMFIVDRCIYVILSTKTHHVALQRSGMVICIKIHFTIPTSSCNRSIAIIMSAESLINIDGNATPAADDNNTLFEDDEDGDDDVQSLWKKTFFGNFKERHVFKLISDAQVVSLFVCDVILYSYYHTSHI